MAIGARRDVTVFEGLKRHVADAGLIASGSISWTAAEDLRVEKKTAEIVMPDMSLHIDQLFLLAIQKPPDATAGDLTVNSYNIIKIDGTTAMDTLHTTHTVEQIADTITCRNFIIQGLFTGEGKIKLGARFAADSGAMTIHWRLYRL